MIRASRGLLLKQKKTLPLFSIFLDQKVSQPKLRPKKALPLFCHFLDQEVGIPKNRSPDQPRYSPKKFENVTTGNWT